MNRIAFRMRLHKGKEIEYQRRHDEIWPELSSLLTAAGIHNYSIYLDEDSGFLFAIMEVDNPAELDKLPEHPIMKRWWAYMSDIMETHADQSPVSIPMRQVFHMP